MVEKLEAAEMTLIRKANQKKNRGKASSENGDEPRYDTLPDTVKTAIRPRHKLLVSATVKKVDTIEWLREQIQKKDWKELSLDEKKAGMVHSLLQARINFLSVTH